MKARSRAIPSFWDRLMKWRGSGCLEHEDGVFRHLRPPHVEWVFDAGVEIGLSIRRSMVPRAARLSRSTLLASSTGSGVA